MLSYEGVIADCKQSSMHS